MADAQLIRASNGSGEAPRATITGLRAPSATSLSVDSLTNFPTKFVATAGTLNEETDELDPSTITVFSGHQDSGNIVIDAFAPGYVDNGNEVGQVVVLKPATMWADNIADVLGVSLEDDGTLNSDAMAQIASDTQVGGGRRIPRISSATSAASITPDVDTYNYYRLTAQAAGLTINAPTGTPNDGDGLLIEITDNGTTRALTWNAAYMVNSIYGLALPTTTTVSKTHFITFVYNSTLTKWVAVL